MIEGESAHAEGRLLVDTVVLDWNRFQWFGSERCGCTKQGTFNAIAMKLSDLERQGVLADKVPCVAAQAGSNLFGQTFRPVKAHMGIPAQVQSQKMIESDEMIDVGVGDEDVRHVEGFTGADPGKISQIQQKPATRPLDTDQDGRIAGRSIEQLWEEGRGHAMIL